MVYSVLTALPFFVPIRPLPTLVCQSVKRHSDMWADTSKQRRGAARYHLCVDATRSRVVKSI